MLCDPLPACAKFQHATDRRGLIGDTAMLMSIAIAVMVIQMLVAHISISHCEAPKDLVSRPDGSTMAIGSFLGRDVNIGLSWNKLLGDLSVVMK